MKRLKKGMRVKIYLYPITKSGLEGEAVLVRKIKDLGNTELWIVKFDDGVEVVRTIRKDLENLETEDLINLLRKKITTGYREDKILARVSRVEKIKDYEPYEGFRVYGEGGDYFEVAKIENEFIIVG